MKKVKIGVVGCGVICQDKYLPFLKQENVRQKVDVVTIYDPVLERAKRACEQFGIKKYCTTYEQMLEETDLDGVCILSPISFHYTQAKKAIESGMHVYTQKPLATTLEQADTLIHLAEKKGVKVVVSPGEMLEPVNQKVKELIDTDVVGKVCFIRAHGSHPGHENDTQYDVDPSWYYKLNGGPLFDVAVYPLTGLISWLGPVERVTAFSGIAITRRYWKSKEIKVTMDDNTLMLLDFGEARFACVDSTFCMKTTDTPMYEIYGSRGVIYVGGFYQRCSPLRIYFSYKKETSAEFSEGWFAPCKSFSPTVSRRVEGIVGDLLHFVDCILENREPVANMRYARHVIEIIEKAYKSAKNGQTQQLSSSL